MLKTFVTLSILLLALQVKGQHWSLLDSNTFRTPFFLNPDTGFLYRSSLIFDGGLIVGHNASGIERTTDGGISWLPIADLQSRAISQLCFVSRNCGYASASDSAGGIYKTNDGGQTWNRLTVLAAQFLGVYAYRNHVFATSMNGYIQTANGGGPVGTIFVSNDDGTSWDSVTSAQGMTFSNSGFQFIYGNKDSLVATTYFDPSGATYLVYSTDLGNQWHVANLGINWVSAWPSFPLCILPHQCKIIRQALNENDRYTFLESQLNYTTWDTSFNGETGSWINGNGCALYLSDADPASSFSLFRSTNEGASWSDIVGKALGPNPTEIDDDDYQDISVVGHGAIVYVSDPLVGLWKTTDGGDGTLSDAALAPQIEYQHGAFPSGNDTLNVSECSTSSAVVYYQNLRCAITKMDSVSMSGLEQNQYSLTSTHYNDCLSLPDSTYITFNSIPPGIYPITVREHFTDDEYNTIDTSLNFILNVQSSGTSVPITLSFQSSSMNASPGDTISVPVYLSGTASLGATSLTLPFGVDTNILVPVGFRPAISGLTVGSLSYSGGIETVPLQINGLTLNGETLLGYLRCIVYLTDTLSTSVTLPTATLNSSTSPCVALSLATDSIAIAIVGCGTKTLQQFLLTDSIPFSISSIVPNPARDEIMVQVAAVGDRHAISYELFDALGKSSVSGSYTADVRSTSLRLDVSPLPAGTYYLRMSEGGYFQTRRVAIKR